MVSCRFFEGLVIFLGIEPNGCWQFPIPGASGPPMGIVEFGCGVDGLALVPDGLIEPAVTLLRRDKLEGVVLVLVIVPVGKRPHPTLGLLQTLKASLCIAWSVLAGAEDGLGKGVVVADARTTF